MSNRSTTQQEILNKDTGEFLDALQFEEKIDVDFTLTLNGDFWEGDQSISLKDQQKTVAPSVLSFLETPSTGRLFMLPDINVSSLDATYSGYPISRFMGSYTTKTTLELTTIIPVASASELPVDPSTSPQSIIGYVIKDKSFKKRKGEL